jgi:hypothetical protein
MRAPLHSTAHPSRRRLGAVRGDFGPHAPSTTRSEAICGLAAEQRGRFPTRKSPITGTAASAPATHSASRYALRYMRGRSPYVIITTHPLTDDRWGQFRRPPWGQCRRPLRRARLADAIVRLRDQRRLTRTQAAYAICHLNTRSRYLLGAGVMHTVAVAVGASRTPGGLQVAA